MHSDRSPVQQPSAALPPRRPALNLAVMSKKPDSKKGASTDADAASSAGAKKKKSSKKGAEGSDSGSDSDDGGAAANAAAVDSDSDDDAIDPKSGLSKSSKAAIDSAEKSQIAAYLSTPSTYVSATPGIPLSNSERNDRAEMEDLLSKIKGTQKTLMHARAGNIRELEGMKASLKKVKKETDELMKNQQTNLATMGRKLH